MNGSPVLVAMSGGVDSSVAAAMLVDQGYDVTGVTLRLWGGEADRGCCSISDVHDARRVADQLGIDHHVFNFAEDFDRHVVEPFARDHAAGRTPNPCIECNRHLKFDLLVKRADVLGFSQIATGHHARPRSERSRNVQDFAPRQSPRARTSVSFVRMRVVPAFSSRASTFTQQRWSIYPETPSVLSRR
jgi:tRNA U34 2-thiouridine synthase MnmA/TrmU